MPSSYGRHRHIRSLALPAMEAPRCYMHRWHMSRRQRPYLPGAVFHLTARTTGEAHLFDEELRGAILELTAQTLQRTDLQLMAYAVMSNHLHLVVRQGHAPLSRLMQTLLRRVALATQRKHGIKGHVFERAYRDKPCSGAPYFRNMLVYTNLNPVRARMCREPTDYAWTSHNLYAGVAGHQNSLDRLIVCAAQMFGGQGLETCHEGYLKFVAYRRAKDAADAAGVECHIEEPRCDAGNQYWSRNFHAVFPDPAHSVRYKEDLRDIALKVIGEMDPDLPPELLHGQYGARRITHVRNVVVRRALLAGHRPTPIARHLGLSVSRVCAIGGVNVRYAREPGADGAPPDKTCMAESANDGM